MTPRPLAYYLPGLGFWARLWSCLSGSDRLILAPLPIGTTGPAPLRSLSPFPGRRPPPSTLIGSWIPRLGRAGGTPSLGLWHFRLESPPSPDRAPLRQPRPHLESGKSSLPSFGRRPKEYRPLLGGRRAPVFGGDCPVRRLSRRPRPAPRAPVAGAQCFSPGPAPELSARESRDFTGLG